MPTWGSPAREAARARASARERPELVGSDSSTTVNPLWPAGQAVRVPGAGAVLVAGGGVVGVTGGPPPVCVERLGRVTVAVSGAVVGVWGDPPSVATIVLFSAPASASTIAAVAPATAITKPSKTRQNQSPGYQPKRSCQALESRPRTPAAGRNRYPHSRQYSWPGSCTAPQRGQCGS